MRTHQAMNIYLYCTHINMYLFIWREMTIHNCRSNNRYIQVVSRISGLELWRVKKFQPRAIFFVYISLSKSLCICVTFVLVKCAFCEIIIRQKRRLNILIRLQNPAIFNSRVKRNLFHSQLLWHKMTNFLRLIFYHN